MGGGVHLSGILPPANQTVQAPPPGPFPGRVSQVLEHKQRFLLAKPSQDKTHILCSNFFDIQFMLCPTYIPIMEVNLLRTLWWLSRSRIHLQHRRCGFQSRVREIPWSRAGPPTSIFLPGESQGQRSLAGCSPWGHKELDLTERLILYSTLKMKREFNRICFMQLKLLNATKYHVESWIRYENK